MLASHAYDHPLIAAGAGTLLDEIRQQVPNLDTVVVAVGGGGLFAGVATAAAEHGVRTIAVAPENCRALNAAIKVGRAVDVTFPRGKIGRHLRQRARQQRQRRCGQLEFEDLRAQDADLGDQFVGFVGELVELAVPLVQDARRLVAVVAYLLGAGVEGFSGFALPAQLVEGLPGMPVRVVQRITKSLPVAGHLTDALGVHAGLVMPMNSRTSAVKWPMAPLILPIQ